MSAPEEKTIVIPLLCAPCKRQLEGPVATLKCLHTFHAACLQQFQSSKPAPTCPTCGGPGGDALVFARPVTSITLHIRPAPSAEPGPGWQDWWKY